VRDLTLIAALMLAVPVCQAQQAPASHLNNVTTPALSFVGLAAMSGTTAARADVKPNAPQTLPGNTIVLNVPFSFESPEPELKGAIVRCVLLAHPNSAHIAEEQIVIPIGGKATSGTAPVTFAPVNNRNVAVAHAYTCFFELSDGKSTTYALGDKGPPWARSQTGSVLLVRGTIP
jgi:hypothetical protein